MSKIQDSASEFRQAEGSSKSKLPIFNEIQRLKHGANHKRKQSRLSDHGIAEENYFEQDLAQAGLDLRKSKIEILQINLGKLCNLTCHHCHVEAGPNRKEIITSETMEQLVRLAKLLEVSTVDLTGGAPEMFPGFKTFVSAFTTQGREVIIRSNLTILLEPGYEDFTRFFADEGVCIVASLPCYTAENVDQQRGDGVFDASITALQQLNQVGYGIEGSGLKINLVYNPLGPFLPGSQSKLEKSYKKILKENFDIEFNSLIAITNLPIGRFYSELKKAGTADAYDDLLRKNFNSETVPLLMCKNTLNVSWDGWVYDCDFNQMLELPTIRNGRPLHICDEEAVLSLIENKIPTGNHCFGCTAGTGSSCGGELTK